jgi:pimeloyl-ACP methyl ester carboxylesterase
VLLAAARQRGPYVLVAHSYGGLIARLYASDYPRQVSGMVLLDVLSPEFRAKMTAQQWATWKIANTTPAAAIKDYPALERVKFDPALNQVENARPIRQMPLAVLTADKPVDPSGFPPGIPASFAKLIDRDQHAAQSDLAKLVKGALWITKTHSGHNIMLDNPRLVSASAEAVIRAVRCGRHRLIG